MDDPWDVKSVRQAGQYTSCMKLNGAPLLPPVLSKECRKEMQYYKLLAKEVEKRISSLQPYVSDSDTESNYDKTDAPEISECEQNMEPLDHIEPAFNLCIDKVTTLNKQEIIDIELPTNDVYETSPKIVNTDASKFVIDVSLSINQTGRNVLESNQNNTPFPIELPERDNNYIKNKELLLDLETSRQKEPKNVEEIINLSISVKDDLSEPLQSISSQDEPRSISSKSFTGSLNDLHTESIKAGKLVRQRSYTLLNPSPQLLAHLEVQSLNTGVEMSCISMSESLSNLSLPNKKRRSWDLESAKVKWSSMAMELKAKKLPGKINTVNKPTVKNTAKTTQAIYSPPRAKSVAAQRNLRGVLTPSKTPKSEPLHKRKPSPIRNIPSNVTIVKGPASSKPTQIKDTTPHSPQSPATPKPVSESEDPAAKVRELYEKIQKQQIVQMASLVEKQKREQMLLQKVFEEQNTLLFKQLKTIVPKSSVEAKEAWGETNDADRGPVSLSQLINHKTPEQISPTSTLTDSNKYIDKCDNVLKKSRDLSNSIKKLKPTNQTNKIQIKPEGSRTRTHSPIRNVSNSSPAQRNASRKLNYDSSSYDPILTDRTNDTMADLNVTFPTDNSDCESYSHNNTGYNQRKEVTVIHATPSPPNAMMCSSTDSAINCMERTIQNSINSCRRPKSNTYYQQPTPREITAACYSLHDTFVSGSAAERCALLAADRARRRALAARPPPARPRHTDF